MRCGHQRSRQRKMSHDQQNCSSSESRYSHGGRNDGCVRAHGNPGSDFPQTSVQNTKRCIDTIMKKTMMCLDVVCKTKNDLSRRSGRVQDSTWRAIATWSTCSAIRRFQLSPAFADKFTLPLTNVRNHCAMWFYRNLGAPMKVLA